MQQELRGDGAVSCSRLVLACLSRCICSCTKHWSAQVSRNSTGTFPSSPTFLAPAFCPDHADKQEYQLFKDSEILAKINE